MVLSSEAEVFIPKVPPRTEFESESESAAENPAMRRTEARDQAECWVSEWGRARASESEREVPICMWSLVSEVLALGWGVALSLHLQHLGCWSNPCQNIAVCVCVCALFSRFSWSVWHSRNDRRMFCSRRDQSLFQLSLIWNTPRRLIHRYFWGLIMHPVVVALRNAQANSFREVSTIVFSCFFFFFFECWVRADSLRTLSWIDLGLKAWN